MSSRFDEPSFCLPKEEAADALPAAGIYEMDTVTDGYNGCGFLLYTYIVKRVNEVAPPTALGTEEWRARAVAGWDVTWRARQLHEVKARVVCER